MSSTITRKVRFNAIIDLDSTPETVWGEFPVNDVFREVEHLGVGTEGRLARSNGQYVMAHPIPSESCSALCMYRVRTESLPMLFNSQTREVRPLDEVLADPNLEIAEPTYFGFFPGGIVAHVYNHVGPRPRDLELYLDHACGLKVELRPIPRVDVMEALREANGVRVLQLKVPASAHIEDADPAELGMTREILNLFPGSDVEIIVRARGKTKPRQLAASVRERVNPLLEHKDLMKKLRVNIEAQDDYAGGALNLLEDVLVIEREFETVSHARYLDPNDAVRGIVSARSELGGQIESGLNML